MHVEKADLLVWTQATKRRAKLGLRASCGAPLHRPNGSSSLHNRSFVIATVITASQSTHTYPMASSPTSPARGGRTPTPTAQSLGAAAPQGPPPGEYAGLPPPPTADPKVAELQVMFPTVEVSVIEMILESVGGSQDRAIETLLSMTDPEFKPDDRHVRTEAEVSLSRTSAASPPPCGPHCGSADKSVTVRPRCAVRPLARDAGRAGCAGSTRRGGWTAAVPAASARQPTAPAAGRRSVQLRLSRIQRSRLWKPARPERAEPAGHARGREQAQRVCGR